jgi:3-oxoacyl-[acyl-carrier protein] reductase
MGGIMITLKNKVALITGASRGIGRAAALMLARAGCDVLINYNVRKDAAAGVASEARKLGVNAKTYQADVSQKAQAENMVDYAAGEFGKIDVLVNNAGVWKYAAIHEMTEEKLRETMELNLNGVFYITAAAARRMIEQKSGNIINVSSTAGQRGEPFHSHYAASKGALISLTKSLAAELAVHNIRVNCVAPGWVDTDMSHSSLVGEEREAILGKIPMGRAGTAEEIAGAIVFLASDLSSYVNGEILNVNGGSVLCG